MTKEEAIQLFRERFRPRKGDSYDLVVMSAVEAMVEVMADAIEELTIHSSVARAIADNVAKNNPLLAKTSEMTQEEWDAWWKKSGELFL